MFLCGSLWSQKAGLLSLHVVTVAHVVHDILHCPPRSKIGLGGGGGGGGGGRACPTFYLWRCNWPQIKKVGASGTAIAGCSKAITAASCELYTESCQGNCRMAERGERSESDSADVEVG